MTKQIIRLTESDLHKLVKESVHTILSEMEDGNLEPQYEKYPDAMWTYGQNVLNPAEVSGLDPHSMRRSGQGNKKQDNLASWDYFDAVRNGTDMDMRAKAERDYDWDVVNPIYPTDFDYEDYKHPNPTKEIKKILDKQWQDTKDMEKINKQANSRPLHGKGSLNRA